MRYLTTSILLVSFLVMNASVFAEGNYTYKAEQLHAQDAQYFQQPVQYPSNNTLKGSVIMVPAGAIISTTLTTPLSTQYTTEGQTVSLALNEDYYYGEHLIAPAGSTIYGTVVESSSAKHGCINGKLCIRFTQIYTPYGTQIPISAVIKTSDSTGVLVGGTKLDVTKDYAKDLGIGSAAGALTGLTFGAIAGGSVGKAAAIGTAIGAGGGLVKAVIDKGQDVVIPANAGIEIMLTQPITVSSSYHAEN